VRTKLLLRASPPLQPGGSPLPRRRGLEGRNINVAAGDPEMVVEPVGVRQRQDLGIWGGSMLLPCPGQSGRRPPHSPSFLTGLSLSSLARRT
jgi:hypothetical protein